MPIEHRTIPVSKVTRPGVQNIVERNRLYSLLDEASERPITWVSAPVGSGKTTLVSDYITHRQMPCLWYQFDSGDTDTASFFYYMGMAVRNALPVENSPMPSLIPESLTSIRTFARRYFEELYARLLRHGAPSGNGGRGAVVVFDDYHEIPSNSEFHDLIASGLDSIPDGLRVIFISRYEPPSRFVRFKARDKISIVGWDEIRFTLKETEAMLRSVFNRKEKHYAEFLHKKTQGWAAGLVLLGPGTADEGMNRDEPPGMEDVFSYFAEEIFQHLDGRLQAFLFKTAFLPEITTSMAEALTGMSDAREILSELCRNNFFAVLHSGEEGQTYRYHPLLRGFLRSRATDFLGTTELLSVRSRSAVIAEGSGRIEDAAGLYIETEDWEGLSSLIINSARGLIAVGRNQTLETWLRKIPRSVFESSPPLQYWMGVARLPFSTHESRAYFETSFKALKGREGSASAMLSWAGAVETIFLERGDFSRLDWWLSEVDDILKGPASITSGRVLTSVVKAMVEIILSRRPFSPENTPWIKKGVELLTEDIPVEEKLAIADPLQLYFIYTGDHLSASELISILESNPAISEASPLARIRWSLIRAVHTHMVDVSPDDCLKYIQEGLKTAEDTGVHLLDIPLYQTGAYASLIRGDIKTSEEFLKKMLPLVKPYSFFDIGNCSSIKLSHDLMRKRYLSALKNAAKTIRMAFRTGSPIPIFLTYLGMAQALIGLGRYRAARNQIEKARKIIKDTRETNAWSWLYLIEAYLLIKKGEAGYEEHLKRAFEISARQQHLNALHWNPEVMSVLCAAALEHGIETGYVKALIRRRNIPLPKGDHPPADWPFPVVIRTLGEFTILIDGRPVEFPGRERQKPLELLKAVIAFGGRNLPVVSLTEAIWPDSEGDRASRSFKFTLHALRKILGKVPVIELNGGKVSLNRDLCQVDIWRFDSLAREIEKSLPMDPARSRLCEDALEQYRGDFLPGDTHIGWTCRLRENIRERALGIASELAGYYSDRAEYEKTIRICNRALEIDCLREEFYRKIMLSYIHLGRNADAAVTYKRCRDILRAELGINPSEETEKLFKKATSH